MAGFRSSRSRRWQISLVAFLSLAPGAFTASRRSEDVSPRPIIVHAKRFAFTPAEITLKKGIATRLILISDDVTHGLTVEGLGIHAEIHKGRKTIIPVTPTQNGDFPVPAPSFAAPPIVIWNLSSTSSIETVLGAPAIGSRAKPKEESPLK